MRTIYRAYTWLLNDSPWVIQYVTATLTSATIVIAILYITHILHE